MAVSLVFQGSNINEVNAAIFDYIDEVPAPVTEPDKNPMSPKKGATPAKKKAVAKKKAAAKAPPENPMDLFGDDEPSGNEEAEAETEDHPFGSTEPTIEDVKNALGEVVSAWDEKNNTGAEKAKKILAVYGDADDLGSLDESLYRKVIANSNILVEKANG